MDFKSDEKSIIFHIAISILCVQQIGMLIRLCNWYSSISESIFWEDGGGGKSKSTGTEAGAHGIDHLKFSILSL